MWKEAIQTELNSLEKREVFGLVVHTPKGVMCIEYKWVYIRKWNENNEIVRYKAQLIAQGFLQRLDIDYKETYYPVMVAITFKFLIGLVVSKTLDRLLMNVVITYIYKDH